MIFFSVPGQPVPWARAGAHGKVRFTPAPQRSYAGVLKLYAQRAMRGSLIDGPVSLTLRAYYLWPKSMSAKKRAMVGAQWKVSKPDADNLVKILKDALNQVVWTDDARIARMVVEKLYDDRPRLDVEITEMLVAKPAAHPPNSTVEFA
jgi:Holliday junction resolvase RusA-like endonuclease